MAEPATCMDPAHRKDYRDLLTLAQQRGKELFTMRQRAQLAIYADYAVTLNQALTTDDSFVLSRLLTQLREAMDELLPIEPGEEQQYHDMRAALNPGYQRPAGAPAAAEPAAVQREVRLPSLKVFLMRIRVDLRSGR